MNAAGKDVLLNAPNGAMLTKYPHVTGIKMNENQTKSILSIYVIFGESDFLKIKTQERPRTGQIADPVAELTKLGWEIVNPRKGSSYFNVLLRTAAINTYEELCSIDVLGLSDTHHLSKPDDVVLQKSKRKLTQVENGYYEINLICKEGQRKLKNNEVGRLGRLKNLVRNIQQEPEKFKEYDEIKAQITNGIVERTPVTPDANREFYFPHNPAFREGAETTKLRVVCDASAKSSRESPSLNSCGTS